MTEGVEGLENESVAIGGREYPAEFAVNRRFYSELLTVFRGIAPLVCFLNHAIVARTKDTRQFVRSLAG